ncbi:M20 aminoacylase family protein [Accumulibacter sp.]|uniref:M20 aminoacylase family protein n=1 Tax=Accumulibacter sp. TaxID=2053492 RepID=UPI0026056B26|nr:M20 aminoacylase family protein [Accumulibacter sp.]
MTTLNIPFIADLTAIRHDLHAHPELAFKETRTSEVVARELNSYGLAVHRGLAGTGVVGVLRKGDSRRAIGLRADMDALPLQEKGECPHRSRNEGRMHACGHDGHTAMLLGAARYLAEHRDELDFDGTVYFVFQPAEESEGGAAVMIADGLFEQFPMDAIFGLHNWPGIPVGEMAVMPGAVMAGTCTFEISVRGHGCHAAMPQEGVDTLVVSSHLVLALQTVVARNVHPCESAVVSVTQIHSGEAWNVIPDDAVLRGTIRTFTGEIQDLVERAIERLCRGIASVFAAQISVRFDHCYPPTINSRAETEICQRVATDLLGRDKVRENDLPSMGAEDFAYMLRARPGCYVWLGNGPGTGGCTLHNPHYDFNDAILPIGVSYWVRLVETALGVNADRDGA